MDSTISNDYDQPDSSVIGNLGQDSQHRLGDICIPVVIHDPVLDNIET
jgi:hypothetical protein